jgi:hypothetical protein
LEAAPAKKNRRHMSRFGPSVEAQSILPRETYFFAAQTFAIRYGRRSWQWFCVACLADQNAGVAELVDALDLGSSEQSWGFDSLRPHQFSSSAWTAAQRI